MAKWSLPGSVHILGPIEVSKWSTRPNSESRMREKHYSNADKSKQLLQAPTYSDNRIYAASPLSGLLSSGKNYSSQLSMVDTALCYPLADKGTSISSHGPVYHATGIEVGFCPVSFDPENGSNNPKSFVKIVIYM